MATDVTVTEAYIQPEYYGQFGLSSYSFTQIVNEGGGGTSNMAWLGSGPVGAVGTYGGENTIVAEDTLLYNEQILRPYIGLGASLGSSTYPFAGVWGYTGNFEDVNIGADLTLDAFIDSGGDNRLLYANDLGVVGVTTDIIWEEDSAGAEVLRPNVGLGASLGTSTEPFAGIWGYIGNFEDVNIGADLTVDTVSEYTTDAGVTIEGVVLKDNGATAGGAWSPSVDQDFVTKAYVDEAISSTIYYLESGGLDVVVSDGYTGDEFSTTGLDSDILQVEEQAGTPGYDIRGYFEGVTAFNSVLLYCYYHGGAAHTVNLQLYNVTTDAWDTVSSFTDQDGFTLISVPIINGDDYIDSASQVECRINHVSAGNATHYIEVSYWVLQLTPVLGSGGSSGVADHGQLAGLSDDDHPQYALLSGRGGETLVIDQINLEDSAAFIDLDSAGNVRLTDGVSGSVLLAELALASGTLTDNYVIVGAGGTNVSTADATVNFNAQDVTNIGTITINDGDHLVSAGSKTTNIGDSSNFMQYVFTDRLYLYNTSDYIYASDTSMNFIVDGTAPFTLSGTSLLQDTAYTGRFQVSAASSLVQHDIAIAFGDLVAASAFVTLRDGSDSGKTSLLKGYQRGSATEVIFDFRDSSILFPNIVEYTSDKILYYDSVTGSITYGDWIDASGYPGVGGGSFTGLGITNLISQTNCSADATTNINIGTTASDTRFRIHYQAERGTMMQSGNIDVMYNPNTAEVAYAFDYVGNEIGMDIQADVSGSDIRLNIIVDDSDSNDVDFEGYVTSSGTSTYDIDFYVNNILEGWFESNGLHVVDRLYFGTSGAYIEKDGSGNMQFTDITGTYDLIDLVGGSGAPVGGYWDQSSAGDLTPADAGNDILLAEGSELLKFGDGDTGIYEGSANVLTFFANSSNVLFVGSQISVATNIHPSANKGQDLGTSSLFWDDLYVDGIYIGDMTSRIEIDVGGNMQFTDATGTYDLIDLAGGSGAVGGGYWDETSAGYLVPASGQAILLDASAYLRWGDGDTYIYEQSDDTLRIVCNSNMVVEMTQTTVIWDTAVIRPGTNHVNDLGTSSYFFDNCYFDKIYLGSTGAYIEIDSSGEITFTDPVNNTVKLSELINP